MKKHHYLFFFHILLVTTLFTPSIVWAFGAPPREEPEYDRKKPENQDIYFLPVEPTSDIEEVTPPAVPTPDVIKAPQIKFEEDIEDRYAAQLELVYPEKDLITAKETIIIKGTNRFLSDVFVNGERINLRNQGGFFTDVPLKKYGKQNVFITYILPDGTPYTVRRKIIKLITPSGLTDADYNKKNYIYFFNTPSMYMGDATKSVEAPLTRADFAYFLGALDPVLLSSPLLNNGLSFPDVPTAHYAVQHIRYAVTNRLMTPFADNTFRPNDPVTRIEYIMALSRRSNLNLNQSNTELPYQDTYSSGWATKYIRAVYNAGLLPDMSSIKPHEILTMRDFIDFAFELPEVARSVETYYSFDNGFEPAPDLVQSVISALNIYENRDESAQENAPVFRLESPVRGEIFNTAETTFTGRIYPPVNFYLDKQLVQPDSIGGFSVPKALSPGRNTFSIKVGDQEDKISVFYLPGYDDLQSHWIEKTAAQLRFINVMDRDSGNFYPDKSVTRAELAQFLLNAYKLTVPASPSVLPDDVTADNEYYNGIVAALGNQIMELKNGRQFYPSDSVTRADALKAMIKAAGFYNLSKSELDTVLFPFKDLPDTHWVSEYVKAAVKKQIIKPSEYFYPDREITRAEFVALLARTPEVQQKLKTALKIN